MLEPKKRKVRKRNAGTKEEGKRDAGTHIAAMIENGAILISIVILCFL